MRTSDLPKDKQVALYARLEEELEIRHSKDVNWGYSELKTLEKTYKKSQSEGESPDETVESTLNQATEIRNVTNKLAALREKEKLWSTIVKEEDIQKAKDAVDRLTDEKNPDYEAEQKSIQAKILNQLHDATVKAKKEMDDFKELKELKNSPDVLARKKLTVAEAEWAEFKAKSEIDLRVVTSTELTQRRKTLNDLETKKNLQDTQPPFSDEDRALVKVYEDNAKGRAVEHIAKIDQFIKNMHPELNEDANARFHYASDISFEYRKNPTFHVLMDKVIDKKPLSDSEKEMLQHFDKFIQERTERRILAHEFIYNANKQNSLFYNADHRQILNKLNNNEILTPDEVIKLLGFELRVNIDTYNLLCGMDFSKAVKLKEIGEGATFLQSQAQGSNWIGRFDITPGFASSPSKLGISSFTDSVKNVFSGDNTGTKLVNYFTVGKPVTVLESIAAPVVDTWSTSRGIPTEGRGKQLFSPNSFVLVRISDHLLKEKKSLEKAIQKNEHLQPSNNKELEKLQIQLKTLQGLIDEADSETKCNSPFFA